MALTKARLIEDNAIKAVHIDETATGITLADLTVTGALNANSGVSGNITGNVTGNVTGDLTGTVLTAAQTNITSVGTLLSLNVTGNVGIGETTSPAYKLEVSAPSGSQRIRIGTLQNGGNTSTFEAITSSTVTTATSAWMRAVYGGGVALGTSTYDKAGGDSGNFANLSSESASEAMRIDNAGNVGIGAIPKAWSALGTTKALQLGTKTALYGAYDIAALANNNYFDGAVKYITTGYASRIVLDGFGNITFENATTGTADAACTLNERMRISETGSVGIGTSSPASAGSGRLALHLNSANGSGITFSKTGQANSYIYTDEADGEALGYYTDGEHLFYTGGSERLRIDASGNVGIGTTSTTGTYGKLSIAGGIRILDDNNAKLEVGRYSAGAPNSYIKMGANSNSLRFTDHNDQFDLVTIANNGNVGIGTSSPSYKLDVGGASNIDSTARFAKTSEGSLLFGGNRSTSNCPFIGSENNYDFAFITNNTERMRIDSSGRITMPYQPAFKAGRTGSYTPGAQATIVFNDTGGQHFNRGNHYSISTGAFTAPVAGVYHFTVVIIYEQMPEGQAMDDAFYLYRNNGLAAYSWRRAEYVSGTTGNGNYYTDFLATTIYLSANDAVTVRNKLASIVVHGNTNYTYFAGFLIG